MPTPHRTGTPQVRHVIMGSLARHGFAIAETDIRVSLASGFWMVLAVARHANLRRVRCRYSGVTPACSGTQEGNDVAKLIKRGILAGWSVEFEVRTESEVNQVRVIEMANLISQFYLSFYRRPPGLFGVIGLGPRAGARQTASENMDMKWRFWESEKRNEQDGYTEGLIRAQLERAKSGNKPKPDQLGSVETAVSLWSRCFASADVTVDGGMGFKALTTLSPSVLALIGRGLAGRGEAIFSVQVQAGKIMLSASSWTLRGG